MTILIKQKIYANKKNEIEIFKQLFHLLLMVLISIEGNIGSGKSTLLKIIRETYKDNKNIIFIDEPVNEWLNIKNSDNKNILELFYNDKKKYSFSFQILAYITRLRKILEAIKNNNNKIIICERSIYSDKNIFAKMLYEQKYINEIDWINYNYWFDTFKEKTNLDGIIYVNTDPELCSKRIAKRNRNSESNIELEYLINCHKNHELWMNKEENILKINGNVEFETEIDNKKNILKLINKFLSISEDSQNYFFDEKYVLF